MNTTSRRISSLFGIFLVLSCLIVPSVLFAQESVLNPEISGTIDSVLGLVVAAFAGKFGVIAKVFSVLATISGFCALTIKPAWDKFVYPAITTYVQSTATKSDDEWLARFLANPAVKVLLWSINLLAHIKVPIIDKDGAAVSPSSAGTLLPPSP